MAKQTVNIGAALNDGTGDLARVAFNKLNLNNDEIYTALGNGTSLTPGLVPYTSPEQAKLAALPASPITGVAVQEEGVATVTSPTINFVGPTVTVTDVGGVATVTVTDTAALGDVTKIGTPVNNQVGVWTGDGTIEGTAGLTYSGTALAVTGTVSSTGNLTVSGSTAAPAEARTLSIGTGRVNDGNSTINLVGDGTYPSYGLQVERGSGVSGVSQISHRGIGDLVIRAQEAASLKLSTTDTVRLIILSDGKVGLGTGIPAVAFEVSGTDAVKVATGTTAQRPVTGINGYIRYNTTISAFEGYSAGSWIDLASSNTALRVGSTVDGQVGVWTGDRTIEGANTLTYDGTTFALAGGINATSDSAVNTIVFGTQEESPDDTTVVIQKARGAALGPTQITSGDDLGRISFRGYDGAIYQEAAYIQADSTANTGTLGGTLTIGSAGADRLQISSTGVTSVGNFQLGAQLTETSFALSGLTPTIDPANGTLQTWTLTGDSTPVDGLANGESVLLHIDDGTDWIITWPTMEWLGGFAPVLDTANTNVIALWKQGGILYGSYAGVAS